MLLDLSRIMTKNKIHKALQASAIFYYYTITIPITITTNTSTSSSLLLLIAFNHILDEFFETLEILFVRDKFVV